METKVAEPSPKRADELERRDWLDSGLSEEIPVEVVAVIPWASTELGSMVTVMYAQPRSGKPKAWNMRADTMVALAADSAIAAVKADAHRQLFRDDLRALSDLLARPQIPVDRSINIYLSVKTRAEVLALAASLELGVPDKHGRGISITWPAGRRNYDDGLTVVWCTNEPEPEEPVSAEAPVPAEDADLTAAADFQHANPIGGSEDLRRAGALDPAEVPF